MATELEDLRVLKAAEAIADEIWHQTAGWNAFARDVVGKQLARAADSVGANIAESYGRFNYGEKLQFLYYARGSLFETKYWLNRAQARRLMPDQAVREHAGQLSKLAHQLNTFAQSIKRQRTSERPPLRLREEPTLYNTLRESATEVVELEETPPLFSSDDIYFIESHSLNEAA